MNLNDLAKDIHANAQAHGWWEEPRSFGEIIALCHSELSEALEEYRNDKPALYCTCKHPTYGCADGYICETPDIKKCPAADIANDLCKYAKPEGVATELADCVIRILDYCAYAGIDIEETIRIKHEFNKTRPYKHGGKKI